jgi:hypothetical protein
LLTRREALERLVDWKWFCIQQQSDQLSWVRDQVRFYDPKHPTHANPSALAYNMPAMGADLWSEKQEIDFAGTTLHASWQFDRYQAGAQRQRRGAVVGHGNEGWFVLVAPVV